MRSSVSVISLLALLHTAAATTGVCTVPYVVERYRYAMDRIKQAWKYEKYNKTLEKDTCCEGYAVETLSPLACVPMCDPPCENSDCMAPDACVCHDGFVPTNNSTNSCFNVCDSCVNGACLTDQDKECTCFHGYTRDPTFPHICGPVCAPACVNALCAAPSRCDCYPGYRLHSDAQQHVCMPRCDRDCVSGMCTGPEECTCFPGYLNDEDSPHICRPICNNTCVNGDCYAPDSCRCHQGFVPHPREPYRCIPPVPQGLFLNYCELLIPRAVQFDPDADDCFLVRETLTVKIPPNCKAIESICGSSCLADCQLQCSLKKLNGSNEIHCDADDREYDIYSPDESQIIINSTEWTDLVLVVNSNKNHNSSVTTREHVIEEYNLQFLRRPICGQSKFAVEVTGCPSSKQGSERIDSSFMLWMNVTLINGFLLLVVAGGGAFLWSRHRKLNNPLNYREDMGQGYGYNNACYDGPGAELVSEDSDQYSDAPL